MNLLLLSMGGIGDFIESVPSIRALRETGKGDFIGLVVSQRVKPYAARCPYVDHVYACPAPDEASSWTGKFLIGLRIAGLGLKLRLKRFDWVLNFMDVGSAEGSRRMRWFLRLIGPSVSGGRNRSNFGAFYDKKIIEKDGDGKSDAEYFYAVAGLLGRALPPASAPDLWVSDQERKEAKALLSELEGNGPLVLIHPGCDRETRRWFPQRFASAALQLCDRRQARFAVVGSRKDWPIAVEVERLARPARVRALPGLKSIGVLAAMIEQADLLISNNSMAMHVAGATKTPCIAICASGDVARDRPPWSRDRMELLWKPLECSPCYYRRCPRQHYMECMEHISVEEVVEVSEKFLMRSALA